MEMQKQEATLMSGECGEGRSGVINGLVVAKGRNCASL